MEKRFCPTCGAEQPENKGKRCAYCGSRLDGAKVSWGWIEATVGFTASIILLFLSQSAMYILGLMLMLAISPFSLLRLQYTFNIFTMTYKTELVLVIMTPEILSFVTLGELVLLIIPVLILKLKKASLRELGFPPTDRKNAVMDVAIGCLAGIGMMVTANITSVMTTLAFLAVLQAIYGPLLGPLLILLAEEFISEINAPFGATNPAQLLLLIASVTLLVAPCEEIATRGFLQQGLEKSWGRWKGLVATAMIFSILHVILYPQSASTMGLPEVGLISVLLALPTYIILSLILGALLQARKYRLITTIAAHASYMVILVIMLSI